MAKQSYKLNKWDNQQIYLQFTIKAKVKQEKLIFKNS